MVVKMAGVLRRPGAPQVQADQSSRRLGDFGIHEALLLCDFGL
jgi:hypothetical protein